MGYSEEQQQHSKAEVNKRKRRPWVPARRDPFGGATTPSATPGKKGLPSLGEDRKKSLQETMQGSGSNSVERFIGLVL